MKRLALALLLSALATASAQGQSRWTDRYDGLILAHSKKHGLDPRLVKALIAAESEFSPEAVSKAGARGLMQVMPATALELGTPPAALDDPQANIAAGTAYLTRLYRAAWARFALARLRYPEGPLWVQRRVLAAYHCGPRCLEGETVWPRRTQRYVGRVLRLYHSPYSVVGAAPGAAPEGDGEDDRLAVKARLRSGSQGRGR